MKQKEREQARILRKTNGESVSTIARLLGVSKGSVSLWVRDIPLNPKQKKRLLQNEKEGLSIGRLTASRKLRQTFLEQRKKFQEAGAKRVKKEDAFYIAGCVLYWAEGSKKRNDLVFTNTDSRMMRFFVDFLRKCFLVRNDQLRVSVQYHTHGGVSERKIRDYWMGVLDTPESCFRKFAQVHIRGKKGKSRLGINYGICRVSVHRTDVVQTIYGSIQGFAGFSEPEWLG